MIPERYVPATYALFRAVFGLLFMSHGLQKIFGMFEGLQLFRGNLPPLASLAGAAGIIEIACGLLIMLGLFTRPAAFVASGEMAVAYFIRHHPMGFWPLVNQGEPAALYCFAFLYMAGRGGGRWSLDRVLGLHRPSRE